VKEFVKKVNLAENIDMSTVTISKDHYYPKAYVIDLPLDSTPDHAWLDIFESVWGATRRMWDRKLFVVGNNLRLATTTENIEDKLDWAKAVVQQTNKSVDEYNVQAASREAQMGRESEERALEEKEKVVGIIKGYFEKGV
jgi:hypothetical protein